MKRKILCFLSLLAVIITLCAVFAISASAETTATLPTASEGEVIDVYIVSGQSNAQGCATVANYPEDAAYDEYRNLLTNGATDVWYWGNSATSFVPTKFGLGANGTYSGTEIGLATALSGNGKQQAIVKLAYGNTNLYNDTTSDQSISLGTWTSPSYIEKYNISTEDNKVGALYTRLITQVESAVSALEEAGYTPVLKGIWFIQGEADTYTKETSSAYEELLETFIYDVRKDLSGVMGTSCAELPFVYGRTLRNSDYTIPAYLADVNAAQDAVAAKNIPNVFMIDTTKDLVDPVTGEQKAPVQEDSWHYDVLSQQMIGEAFVRTLEQNTTVTTKYGTIPEQYIDINAYPFVVFDESKEFIGAYSNLVSAASPAKNLVMGSAGEGKTGYILLRRDYTFGETGTSDAYANYSQVGGTLVIDLGNNTFTLTDKVLFDATKKTTGTELHDTNMSIINGEIQIGSKSIMYPNHSSSATEVKNFNFLYENVTFSFVSTSCHANPFMTIATGSGAGSNVNVDLVDCTFKFDKVLNGKVTLFNLTQDTDTISVNVNIKGGTIISSAAAMEMISFAALGTNDTFNFARGNDGEFTYLKYPSADAAPTTAFPSVEGDKYFYYYSESAGVAVYRLRDYGNPDDSIKTEYGVIPEEYRSAEDYPFVVFDGNGNFLYAAPYLYGQTSSDSAMTLAKNYIKTNKYNGTDYGDSAATAVILMRKDWSLETGYNGSTEYFNNFAQIQGQITIDLGGYTLKARSTAYLVDGTMKSWDDGTGDATVFPSTQVFKNGNIVIYAKALIYFTPKVDGKDFTFRFENIDFSVEGYSSYFAAGQASTTYNVPAPTLEFIDCTIDITKATNASLVLFHLGNGNVNPNILVSGCEIIAESTDFTIYSKDEAGTGTLTLRESETNYNTLVLPVGVSAPSDDGLEFVKVTETEDSVTYKMSVPGKSDISFVPKASITLGSELVYNVYVPAVDYLKSFTVDGKTYENLEPVTLDDGNQYYKISVPLSASEAARNVVLEATVTTNYQDHSGTWTMSIPKYAKKVIESNATEAEVTLVKDVLSYIRAAYAYFDKVNEEQIAMIDSILGESYDENNAPALNGSADKPTTGLSSVTYILDATPAIRFHITGEADLYAFYVDGVKLKTVMGTDEKGTYLEMDVYAYAMGQTITYTIDGVESGSYHINCYYTFVTTDDEYKDNAELINLVARFAKYCESAAAYRKSVLENS